MNCLWLDRTKQDKDTLQLLLRPYDDVSGDKKVWDY